MAGYNRIIIIGNLTRDPDYKQLSSGQPLCRLGIASNRQYKQKATGTVTQDVCFIDVDVFGPQAESCRQYLQKGRPVLIEGRLKFDSWQTPEGQTRSKHSIIAERVVFLGGGQQEVGDSEEIEIMPAKSVEATSPKKAVTKVVKNSPEEAQFEFKDEPPFQDDLPF